MFGIAWLANPLVRKAILYSAIALAALWLMRWYSNKQYDKGFDKGRVNGIQSSIDAHEKEWAEAKKSLDDQEKGLQADKAQIDKDRQAVLSGRTAIVSTLTRGQEALGVKIESLKPFVAGVPESQLDAEIRKQLGALR